MAHINKDDFERDSHVKGEPDGVAPMVPTRSAPPPPRRSAPAVPPNRLPEATATTAQTERPVPPRPQPSAPAMTKGTSTSNASKHAPTKTRVRPVITVVDARPMTQVGFRDEFSAPSKETTGRPEITVVAARPMSEEIFRSAGSTSPSAEKLPVTAPTNQSEMFSGGVELRQRPRGTAPPRPTSMPMKPPPPRIPSMRRQHTASQNHKPADRLTELSSDDEEPTKSVVMRNSAQHYDVVRRPVTNAPPRPVSRPQSLQFHGGNRGSDQDTPSGSSGYGSQLTTSESQPSLSGVDSPPGDVTPPRRKQMIGVQVLPGIVPGMLRLNSRRSTALKSPKEDEREITSPPPQPRPRNLSPQNHDVMDAGVTSSQPEKAEGPSAHPHGVMVFPPMPKPRAPSPRPRTPRSPTPVTPTKANETPTSIQSHVEGVQLVNSQNLETNRLTENTSNVHDGCEKQKEVDAANTSPPVMKPRLSAKPKPATKPKPSIAAKPRPQSMVNPPGAALLATPVDGPDVDQWSLPDRLYPTLPDHAPESELAPAISTDSQTTGPIHENAPRVSLSPEPKLALEAEAQPPTPEGDVCQGDQCPKPPSPRPPSMVKNPPVDVPESRRPPPRPQSPAKRASNILQQELNLVPHEMSENVEQIVEAASEKPTTPSLEEHKQELNVKSNEEAIPDMCKNEVQRELADHANPPVGPVTESQTKQEPPKEKPYSVLLLPTEGKLYPSLPKHTKLDSTKKAFPKVSVPESHGSDSFYDDDDVPPGDPFYTKKSVQSVVDTRLFSLMAAKKEDDSSEESSKLKRYFSQTEIREKESSDPGVDFYKNHPEILSTDFSPPRLKRPTIIRPKKVTTPAPSEEPAMEVLEESGKNMLEEMKNGSGESKYVCAKEQQEDDIVVTTVIAKRPTIIRAVQPKPPNVVEKTGTPPVEVMSESNPVSHKKPAPPAVKPKPRTPLGRAPHQLGANPPPALPLPTRPMSTTSPPTRSKSTTPPPPTRPKSTTPPATKPKPLSPKPSSVKESDATRAQFSEAVHPSSPSVVGPQSPAARRSPRSTHISPILLSKLNSAGIARTPSMSSLEETENILNERRIQKESGSSSHSDDKGHPVELESAIRRESVKVKPPPVLRKSWVPPGAVMVMGGGIGGGPPPLPRTGPVAASTPDLRIQPEEESAMRTRSLSQSQYSPPPTRSTPLTNTTRSVSMMALHWPAFDQEPSVIVKGHKESIPEEKPEVERIEEVVGDTVKKATRPLPARPATAPLRPSALPQKAQAFSGEPSPEEPSQVNVAPKRPPPSRPGPPSSPTVKKAAPPRAPDMGRGSPPRVPARPGPGHPLYHYVVQGPHGIALFDYSANADDELSFKAGDVIDLEEQVSEAWMVGRNVDKMGIFPSNFIDVIEAPPVSMSRKREPSVSSTDKDGLSGTGPRCVARFDYDSEDTGDLSFTAGEVISLTGRVGDEWLKGTLRGKAGLFPVAFVEVIEDFPELCEAGPLMAVQDAPRDVHIGDATVTATFDYEGGEGDLSLKTGDKVKVLSKLNDDWLFGETTQGDTGTFPAGFVDRMPNALPLHDPPASNPSPEHVAENPATTGASSQLDEPYCVAEYDYVGDDGDLSFTKGDTIQLVGRVGVDWLRGTLGAKTGNFPKGFVIIIHDLPDPSCEINDLEPNNAKPVDPAACGRAIALYEYEGDADGDLTLKVGDDVILLSKVSDEWYSGTIDDRHGMFPAGFVKVIQPLPDVILDPPDSYA